MLELEENGRGAAFDQEEEDEARRCTALWSLQVDSPSPCECLHGWAVPLPVRLKPCCVVSTKDVYSGCMHTTLLPLIPLVISSPPPFQQAKLWEDSDSRRHTLAASPGSNGSQSSAPLNPGALPKAEPGRYSNAKVSVESCSSVASTKTRFSCSDLPQHISIGANSQPLVRAPRPLGVPRFQQSITHKAQVALSEESTLDFSLPLPVLPTEEKTTKDVERRSRKVSGVAAPPGDVKPPSDSPTNVTMATVQEAEPVPTPSPCDEGLRCEDGDKEGSTDSLDLCLEELSKSPHFDEYLRLIRQEAKPGAHLTKPFTFSYFDLYKLA